MQSKNNKEQKTIVVSIHQPNFLPYPGFFNKLKSSDLFVLYDTAQYVKNRWDNRNRLRTKDNFCYITIPLSRKDSYKKTFREIMLPKGKWRDKHKATIKACYSRSPYFNQYFDGLESIYDSDIDNLADFNFKIITFINKSFGIRTKILRSSQMEIDTKLSSSALLADIVLKAGGNTYLSGPSGSDYMNEKDFKAKEIDLIYQKYTLPKYKQTFPGFVNNLSAIDLLFNQGLTSATFL